MVENGRDRRAHLERSRRVWDRWSRFYAFNDRDTEPVRRRAIETLNLAGGETVLDVGCGPGSNFDLLADRVGPDGRVVGVDFSPKMVAKARSKVEEHGWNNVEVVRADATRPVVQSGTVDACVATLAVSAMPDSAAVVGQVADALQFGGSFAVYDVQLVTEGPLRVFNPVIDRFFRYFANRNPDADVVGDLGRAFESVEVVETYLGGSNFVAVARSPDTG